MKQIAIIATFFKTLEEAQDYLEFKKSGAILKVKDGWVWVADSQMTWL